MVAPSTSRCPHRDWKSSLRQCRSGQRRRLLSKVKSDVIAPSGSATRSWNLGGHVEDLDLGVDGAPQIDHPAIDFQIDFVTRKRRQNSNMLSRRDLPAAKTVQSTEDDQ